MSRVEELPDDFQEGEELGNNATAGPTDGSAMDDLYDRAARNGGLSNKTFEEALSDLSKTPLFMNDLSNAGDENGENDMLEALKALQYEGTKAEVAQNFKEQGNESVAEKRWRDAKEYYSKGLGVLLFKGEGSWEQPKDVKEEQRKQKTLTEQLYTNRALANLELKNYRSTTLDCAAAISLDPSNVKAHYRSASALFALDKVYEALDVCYRGMKIDPQNAAMKSLLERIQKRSRIKETQDRKRKAEETRIRKEKALLATALKARGIRLRGSVKPPDMADAEIRLSPDPLSPKSQLEFPLMLLYPMHSQSDFIKAYVEKDALEDHFGYILPLPWDAKGEYKLSSVECYMDTIGGGLMKIGKKLSLLEILSNGKTEVVDGLVRIHVVPQSLSSQWIAELKQKKGK